MEPVYWYLILQLVLIIINAVFACAEIAVISINDAKLARLASTGEKRALRLAKLTEHPARFLSTIQVGITLAGFLASAFAADNFSDRAVDWLVSLGVSIPTATLDTLSVIMITLILSYFTLVFGELVPKRIAMQRAEELALAMSGFVYSISKLFGPLVWLLSASTNGVLRLLGVDPYAEDETITEEEIRFMVDAGSQKGTISFSEKNMIQNIFEFDDRMAEEVMTHRTEVTVLWLEETDEEWEKTITEGRHSVYPVCSEHIDNVIGIIRVKDYFRIKQRDRKTVLTKVMKPAYFVPETVRTDVLFTNMKKSRNHFAVVLDEYGGMSGIITMKDLLEQLVGDLENDESIPEDPPLIELIDSHTWKIKGTAPLDMVADHLQVTLPEEDYDTFGGLVFGLLGSVPEDGATPELEEYGLSIKVTEIRGHRLETAIVCLYQDADSYSKRRE
ncbi:MAG: HlyC/CorC family transporter [Syntrophomonadaceae bacterium]|nr:HlyC/CorC family transporter [Syntrophomonadaceae bacterium]